MNERTRDARQCPYCRAWVRMPLRHARAAFDAHKLICRASVPGAVQPSTADIDAARRHLAHGVMFP